MKRNLSLILALCLLLALTLNACGGDSDVGGSVTPNQNDAPVETTLPEKELSMGRMEGGTYTNTYAGFAVDLDESWTFYSAEELQEIPENVADAMSGSEMGDALAGVDQFTDMMAESMEASANINVLYQKLNVATRLAYAALSDEQIADQTLAQSDMLIEAYAQAGMEVTSMEKTTIDFLGQEQVALKTVYTMQGVTVYCLQVMDYHLGEYSVTTTFSSFINDTTAELAAMFYAVE